MAQSTAERLRAQTEQYIKEYQEQKRLSPKEISVMVDTVIRTQTNHIIELETTFARERKDLEAKIRDLEFQLKWANEVVKMARVALEGIVRLRGGKVWVPNERAIAATQKEKEGTDASGHDSGGPEERD